MSPVGCPLGLCDDDSECRYCARGGRHRMAEPHAQENWVWYVDAQRDALQLAQRNARLVIENDALQATITRMKNEATCRSIATALYQGEG